VCKQATALHANYNMIEHDCKEDSDTADFYSCDKCFICRSEGELHFQVFAAFLRLYNRFCVSTTNYATMNMLFHS